MNGVVCHALGLNNPGLTVSYSPLEIIAAHSSFKIPPSSL